MKKTITILAVLAALNANGQDSTKSYIRLAGLPTEKWEHGKSQNRLVFKPAPENSAHKILFHSGNTDPMVIILDLNNIDSGRIEIQGDTMAVIRMLIKQIIEKK